MCGNVHDKRSGRHFKRRSDNAPMLGICTMDWKSSRVRSSRSFTLSYSCRYMRGARDRVVHRRSRNICSMACESGPRRAFDLSTREETLHPLALTCRGRSPRINEGSRFLRNGPSDRIGWGSSATLPWQDRCPPPGTVRFDRALTPVRSRGSLGP